MTTPPDTKADSCAQCGRLRASSQDQFDADESGALCGRGLRPRKDNAIECAEAAAHRYHIRLMRAESLLRSASMSYVMDSDYRSRVSGEIDAFLAEPSR